MKPESLEQLKNGVVGARGRVSGLRRMGGAEVETNNQDCLKKPCFRKRRKGGRERQDVELNKKFTIWSGDFLRQV